MLALMTANTAGSEPSGTSVADMRLIKKTDVRPTAGTANTPNSQWIADKIIEWSEAAGPGFFAGRNRYPAHNKFEVRFNSDQGRPL
jgi:hypothetical protein